MKTIRFVLFLFYRYYDSGRREMSPHFHAVLATAALFGLNIATGIIFFDAGELIFGGSKSLFFVKFVAFFTVTSLILNLIGSKRTIEEYNCEYSKAHNGKWFLIAYIILSVGLLILSISFMRKK